MTPAARRNARRVLAVLTRLLDQKRDADFVRGVATLARISSGAAQTAGTGTTPLTPAPAAVSPGTPVPRRPYTLPAEWEALGRSEPADAVGITGQWLIPATIRRAGAVVTVPGGPLPRPQWHVMLDFGRAVVAHLGVPVLLWDYHAIDGMAYTDLLLGIDAARARFRGPVVLASHSFGGVPAAYAALCAGGGPDAYVAVSSVLSLDDVLPNPGDAYRAAGADPRAFGRRIPVSVITGTEDIPSCRPDRARDFVDAYRRFGGDARLTVIAGAGHTDTLLDLATLEEIGRHLGGPR